MKKQFIKIIILGSLVFTGLNITGCTDFERGLATGAAVGVGTAVIANESKHSNYRGSYYNRGYRNGCTSAQSRWYKNSYYWRNFAGYRNGWRDGYRNCR